MHTEAQHPRGTSVLSWCSAFDMKQTLQASWVCAHFLKQEGHWLHLPHTTAPLGSKEFRGYTKSGTSWSRIAEGLSCPQDMLLNNLNTKVTFPTFQQVSTSKEIPQHVLLQEAHTLFTEQLDLRHGNQRPLQVEGHIATGDWCQAAMGRSSQTVTDRQLPFSLCW